MENTIKETVGNAFANFLVEMGFKKAPVKIATPVAAAKVVENVGKKVVKLAKATPKAEVLTTDADVAIYTDVALADFVADPTKEVKAFSDEAKTVPMADGSYKLKDGSEITVAAGIVTEYAEAEVEANVDELKARVAELEAALSEQETTLRAEFDEAMASGLEEIKNSLGSDYKPKAAAVSTTATRTTTTKVVAQGKSMKEQAAERKVKYKKK